MLSVFFDATVTIIPHYSGIREMQRVANSASVSTRLGTLQGGIPFYSSFAGWPES